MHMQVGTLAHIQVMAATGILLERVTGQCW